VRFELENQPAAGVQQVVFEILIIAPDSSVHSS